MMRRRRCELCNELFTPDPRVGKRQRACGRPACQRERHRPACKAWREREAEQEERLRRRLGAPNCELHLGVVRDECGLILKVVLEEALRLFSEGSRDEFRTKPVEQRRESLRLIARPTQDEREALGPAPYGFGMLQLEIGHLDLRHANLRILDPGRVSRLAASLAREEQRSPVLVVDSVVLVDGYHRVAALTALGRDLVQAVELPVSCQRSPRIAGIQPQAGA